jgi:hypothetical protein
MISISFHDIIQNYKDCKETHKECKELVRGERIKCYGDAIPVAVGTLM